ncbi:MAG: hypothetical protein R6Y91_08980 [Desulfohalobium sp.]
MYTQWVHRIWLPICLLGWVLSMGGLCLAEPSGETPFAVPDAKMLKNAPEPAAQTEQMPGETSSPEELDHLKSVVQMPPVPALSDPRTPLPEPSEAAPAPVQASTEVATVEPLQKEEKSTSSAPPATTAAPGGGDVPSGLRAVADL